MTLLLTVIVVALVFEYINGFHDTANSVAAVVGTRALTPSRPIMLAAVTALGLLLIWNLELWDLSMLTLALVITATVLALAIAIPLGIAAARSEPLNAALRPVLDFMQTMPSFVYLIPAVIFFGLGSVPAIIATVIFAMPPALRLTNWMSSRPSCWRAAISIHQGPWTCMRSALSAASMSPAKRRGSG